MSSWFTKNVYSLTDQGYELVVYGAAAKGMTLLNYMKPSNISYIVDDAPMKQGTYSPGLNILVQPTTYLSTSSDKDIAIIVFAWNFLEEIISKIRRIRHQNRKTLIIVPFPKQSIYILEDSGYSVLM